MSDTPKPSQTLIETVDLYQSRKKIYIRKVEGFFEQIRISTIWVTLGIFFIAPWLQYNQRQSILFDIQARQFHIFNLSFWPQDLFLLALGLITAAFGLFFFTNLIGRVWCGYTCPQTVWTKFFIWFEEITEGSRHQRIRLDQQPMSLNKASRKLAKHGLWMSLASLTGITFVGYFVPIRELSLSLLSFDLGGWPLFWICFFTFATYLNAGWMREQVCIYICPYSRFQSVMFDTDTVSIAYDAARGEPRGSRRKEDPATDLGDCIECQMCVQVCPTGIDIRDGLQYECIGCAACVDACDSVMDQMGYKPGLIRYTSERVLAGLKPRKFRPRLIGYGLAFLVSFSALTLGVIDRPKASLDIERGRTHLYRIVNEGQVENSYRLTLTNKLQTLADYQLFLKGTDKLELVGMPEVQAKPNQRLEFHIQVIGDLSALQSSQTTATLVLVGTSINDIEPFYIKRKISFLSPPPKGETRRLE